MQYLHRRETNNKIYPNPDEILTHEHLNTGSLLYALSYVEGYGEQGHLHVKGGCLTYHVYCWCIVTQVKDYSCSYAKHKLFMFDD